MDSGTRCDHCHRFFCDVRFEMAGVTEGTFSGWMTAFSPVSLYSLRGVAGLIHPTYYSIYFNS